MSAFNTALLPYPFSFIQWQAPAGYGDCKVPLVDLPMLNPNDLSFQLTLAAVPGYRFAQSTFTAFRGTGVMTGNNLNISTVVQGLLYVGCPIYGTNIPPNTFITAFNSGTGGVGTYILSNTTVNSGSVTITDYKASGIISPTILGTLGARICIDCDGSAPAGPSSDFQWIASAATVTQGPGSEGQVTWYFQFTGDITEWNVLPAGSCFNICIYEVGVMQTDTPDINPLLPGISPYDTIAQVGPLQYCSWTTFYKIAGECESYPTAVLQYANTSDAFGFYYDPLGQLTPPGINFLEAIRLPLYLHSPEDAEQQQSYQKSDGSTLKLVHRIWTDYKFKTDYLDAYTLKALSVATAHDFVFITCHYEGIDPWSSSNVYATGYPTQFVRNEKIETEWQQETIPRYKLGQAKGTIRLAQAASNVNANCF